MRHEGGLETVNIEVNLRSILVNSGQFSGNLMGNLMGTSGNLMKTVINPVKRPC